MRASKILPTALALTLAWGASGARSADEIRYHGYFPTFPAPATAQGIGPEGGPGVWLGGDTGLLCPIDESRMFYSFADVAIGPPGSLTRKDSTNVRKGLAVGNTIAIATCRNGRFEVQHYFRGSPDRPQPFFMDENNLQNDPRGSRLWLRKAFHHKGKLYIFALQIFEPGDPYNTFIIRVANPLESPAAWNYEYINLGINPPPKPGKQPPADQAVAYFGKDGFIDAANNYLYTYGIHAIYRDRNFSGSEVTALRIPLDRLETAPAGSDLGPVSEFLTSRPGVWRSGLIDVKDYHKVGIPAFNSFSVRYNATLKAWQAVFGHDWPLQDYIAGKRQLDDPKVHTVYAMTSQSPFGPWSDPRPIARYPEMDPGRANVPGRASGNDCFAYFANEQAAFEAWDGVIVLSYSVGSLAADREHNDELKNTNMKLYNTYAWPAANPFFGPEKPAQVR